MVISLEKCFSWKAHLVFKEKQLSAMIVKFQVISISTNKYLLNGYILLALMAMCY